MSNSADTARRIVLTFLNLPDLDLDEIWRESRMRSFTSLLLIFNDTGWGFETSWREREVGELTTL
jgi:hypothetical protein